MGNRAGQTQPGFFTRRRIAITAYRREAGSVLREKGFSRRPRRKSGFAGNIWRLTALIFGGWLAIFLGVVVGFHLWAPHVVRQRGSGNS